MPTRSEDEVAPLDPAGSDGQVDPYEGDVVVLADRRVRAPGISLVERLRRIRTLASRSERARRLLLLVALGGFVLMGYVALRSYPSDVPQSPRWALLVAVGTIGALVTVALNAAEYRLQGRMLGRGIGFGESLRITILASAANLLPIPGSVVVRTQALATTAGYRAALQSTSIVAGVWLLCTAGLAGVALVVVGLPVLGAALAIGSIIGLAATTVPLRRIDPGWRSTMGLLMLVESGTALVGAARLFGILVALGLDVSGSQAVAMTLSGVIAAATGIFPAGIGVREAVAAGIASIVDLPASVGFVAAAADRIAGLAVLSVLSAIILLRRHPVPQPEAQTDVQSTEDIAEYYTDYSSWYDDERRHGYYGVINALELDKIAVRPGERALEVGCGTGLLLERTSKVADQAVGVDLSPGMAGVSRDKGLTVANASVTSLPFPDATFDVVYSCKVLPHVPDIADGIREIQRVAKPGSRLLLEFYNPIAFKRLTYSWRWRGHREAPVFVRFDSVEDIRRILPDGVRLDSVRGTRTFGPTRHFYTLPLLGALVRWLDRRCCDTWIARRFGGYLLLELRDTRQG